MSTGSWSLIAAGALTLLAIIGFAIGSLLSRPSKESNSQEDREN